jgi:hypothetical protein
MKQTGIKCCLYQVVLTVPHLWVDGSPFHYQAHMQNRKKQLLDSASVHPSILIEHLGSHWTDFHKI